MDPCVRRLKTRIAQLSLLRRTFGDLKIPYLQIETTSVYLSQSGPHRMRPLDSDFSRRDTLAQQSPSFGDKYPPGSFLAAISLLISSAPELSLRNRWPGIAQRCWIKRGNGEATETVAEAHYSANEAATPIGHYHCHAPEI